MIKTSSLPVRNNYQQVEREYKQADEFDPHFREVSKIGENISNMGRKVGKGEKFKKEMRF